MSLAEIPVRVARADGDNAADGPCAGRDPYVLRVLGDAMQPEFSDGDIIVIEPDERAVAGAYVIAQWNDAWIFSQLVDDAGWCLRPLNPAYPEIRIPGLDPIRGVITQRVKPGRRRETKRYVD